MLVTSIFSFSRNVFYRSQNKFQVTFDLSSANAFNLDKSKILSFGKELTKYKYSWKFSISQINNCSKFMSRTWQIRKLWENVYKLTSLRVVVHLWPAVPAHANTEARTTMSMSASSWTVNNNQQINKDCHLTLSQTTDFRLFQIERVSRWQVQIWWKW